MAVRAKLPTGMPLAQHSCSVTRLDSLACRLRSMHDKLRPMHAFVHLDHLLVQEGVHHPQVLDCRQCLYKNKQS